MKTLIHFISFSSIIAPLLYRIFIMDGKTKEHIRFVSLIVVFLCLALMLYPWITIIPKIDDENIQYVYLISYFFIGLLICFTSVSWKTKVPDGFRKVTNNYEGL